MKVLKIILASMLFATLWSADAHAQSFGDRLRGMAERAVGEMERSVDRNVGRVIQCAFEDRQCIRDAERRGDRVEIVQSGQAGGQTYGSVAPCPQNGRSLRQGNSLTCQCVAGSDTVQSGTVWGSGPYSGDSAICRAARHAGAIGPQGGVVTMRLTGGQSSYHGSERNGVSSNSWGSFPNSLVFEARNQDGMVWTGQSGQGGDHQTGGQTYGGVDFAPCPQNGRSLRQGNSLTCQCVAGSDTVQSGTVWGSGPYSGDSAICRAARHAGAIGPQGGVVTVRLTGGQSSYHGSERNGVSSNSWGSFPNSLVFEY
ncbi:MAG: LCCL domain-containing protein [Brevundimonas sp.]